MGIKEGWRLEKTARFANAVGALSVTRVWAWSALPHEREVEEFIRKTEAIIYIAVKVGLRYEPIRRDF